MKPPSRDLPGMIVDLFPARERWLLMGVMCMGILSALCETLGVASILPFMSALMNPAYLERYPLLLSSAEWLGIRSPQGILAWTGFLTGSVVALASTAGAVGLVVQQRFGARTTIRLSATLFAGYMAQPVAFHVERDSPSLLKLVLNDARGIVIGVLNPCVVIVSKCFVVLSLLMLLMLQKQFVPLLVALALAIAYVIVFAVFRARQHQYGSSFNTHNLDHNRAAQEGLGALKELQVLGREQHAIDRFERAIKGSSMAEISSRISAGLPRFAFETVAYGSIIVTTLLLLTNSAATEVIPVLALCAFAGYRLLPAAQQIFASGLSIRFNAATLRDLHRDYMRVRAMPSDLPAEQSPQSHLEFSTEIRLENVSFVYPGAATPALLGVNLVIHPRESIGLVGHTGAGKSTLADLILGLHAPTGGTLRIDGVALTAVSTRAWRKHIGYVPQHVFLANTTIAENIAFGMGRELIEPDRIARAIKLAQADGFIDALPHGVDTMVGERGIKLSGGQRQRIGIARALYHDPQVLVFDEATNALDGLTEDALMQAISSLGTGKTIILVAHRLRTVEACDRIVMLDKGRIVADGSYTSLRLNSDEFRRHIAIAQSTTASSN